jgi:hypothetical protein
MFAPPFRQPSSPLPLQERPIATHCYHPCHCASDTTHALFIDIY